MTKLACFHLPIIPLIFSWYTDSSALTAPAKDMFEIKVAPL